MLRTDRDYQAALTDCEEAAARLAALRTSLEDRGYSADTLEDLLDSETAFVAQIQSMIDVYQRARVNRDIGQVSLSAVGFMLIQMRTAAGLTQHELAVRLGVSDSLVSRDERNDYHGITVERAARIADALGWAIVLTAAPATQDDRRAADNLSQPTAITSVEQPPVLTSPSA